jgi:hypothetical protein
VESRADYAGNERKREMKNIKQEYLYIKPTKKIDL